MLIIEEMKKIDNKSKQIFQKLKNQIDNLDLKDFRNESYENCNYLFKQIKNYISNENLLKELTNIIWGKKIEKYPGLLKPTYYPEIDLLKISDKEKLRLDKAARKYCKYVLSEKILRIEGIQDLSIQDLKLLYSIGITEKKYTFKCPNCCLTCEYISEIELNKHKRVWELERNLSSVNSKVEFDELYQLERDGYGYICVECLDCNESYEISNEEQFKQFSDNIEIIYKIVRSPNLFYEKL